MFRFTNGSKRLRDDRTVLRKNPKSPMWGELPFIILADVRAYAIESQFPYEPGKQIKRDAARIRKRARKSGCRVYCVRHVDVLARRRPFPPQTALSTSAVGARVLNCNTVRFGRGGDGFYGREERTIQKNEQTARREPQKHDAIVLSPSEETVVFRLRMTPSETSAENREWDAATIFLFGFVITLPADDPPTCQTFIVKPR